MSFLFGGGDSGASAAQQKQLENQEKQIAKEEKKLAAQETEAAQTRQATMTARRRGGLRPLLSAARMDAETGIANGGSKLGGNSSYMG